jgi:hypothetical protein
VGPCCMLWVDVVVATAYASGCLGAVPGNLVTTSGMEDVVPASTGKPCSGF